MPPYQTPERFISRILDRRNLSFSCLHFNLTHTGGVVALADGLSLVDHEAVKPPDIALGLVYLVPEQTRTITVLVFVGGTVGLELGDLVLKVHAPHLQELKPGLGL